MELVFFIIPTTFIVIGISYFLFMTFGVPQDSKITLNWGALHTKDFRQMSEEQCLWFRKKLLLWIPLAVVVMSFIGVLALTRRAAHQGNTVLFVYLAVQFAAGFLVIQPTFRCAKQIKKELLQK